LNYVQAKSQDCKMKEADKNIVLEIKEVVSVKSAISILDHIKTKEINTIA